MRLCQKYCHSLILLNLNELCPQKVKFRIIRIIRCAKIMSA